MTMIRMTVQVSRDYIHVVDLAIGHVRAVEKLKEKQEYPYTTLEQEMDILFLIW